MWEDAKPRRERLVFNAAREEYGEFGWLLIYLNYIQSGKLTQPRFHYDCCPTSFQEFKKKKRKIYFKCNLGWVTCWLGPDLVRRFFLKTKLLLKWYICRTGTGFRNHLNLCVLGEVLGEEIPPSVKAGSRSVWVSMLGSGELVVSSCQNELHYIWWVIATLISLSEWQNNGSGNGKLR